MSRVSDESLQHYLGQASTEECNCWSCNCVRNLLDARARIKELEVVHDARVEMTEKKMARAKELPTGDCGHDFDWWAGFGACPACYHDARARCKKLEEALGLVEWVAEQDVHPPPDKLWCPCCGSYQDEGHDKSCEVAHALHEKGGEE